MYVNNIFALQSLILQIAQKWLDQEKAEDVAAKEAYMAENCPPPPMSGDQNTLMVREREGGGGVMCVCTCV